MKKTALLMLMLTLSGCASPYNRKDPLEPLNRKVYKFNDTVDKAVLKPVAKGYKSVVPLPARLMVGNFFSNLNDVVVVVNDVFQLKGRQAFSDVGRVLINSTLGFAGLVDVAGPSGYHKHDEDFGQTLGYWGLGPGPYLVLPFLGPSTFRDGLGALADSQFYPVNRTSVVARRNRLILANGIDRRADLLDTEDILMQAALDPYAFIRDAYLQHRRSLIYDGNPPMENDDDEADDASPGK
ncbi:MAG: VacJ family lipoprotein [Burkholderiales bacterium]|nr:VacJ family lipoprotein [Burkholderiales bacterium]